MALPRDNYDVAIVGAGTTGLSLACLLIRQGVRVVVIDPNRIVCQHPRGSHIDDECMRFVQTLGLAEAEKKYMLMGGFGVYNERDEPLLYWEMSAGETDQGWQSDYQFFQPDFEAALRGQLAMSELADLRLGWDVTEVTQDDMGASILLRHRGSQRTVTLCSSYVVGCDGARSIVREHVMSELEDFQGTRRSLIIDVHKFKPLDTLPATSTYIKAGARPFTHQPTYSPISRFQFMLLGEEDSEQFEDPNTIYELLRPWLSPDSYRIMRSDVYVWNSHLIKGWRSGRLLIAGDAAHLMPPALGQGMCSGMRDAANLAWKLARVISGRSHPDLLDTYESERSPHVRAMIAESTRQANLIAAVGMGQQVAPTGVVDRPRGSLGPGLQWLDFALSGQLSPQPRTSDGLRLDDSVGYAFMLAGRPEVLAGVSDSVKRAWRSLGAVVVDDPGPTMLDWLSSQDLDAVVVRPDRYIFAGTRGSEELGIATEALQQALTEARVKM